MDEFLVAGSTSGEADERVLDQVVRIAGYSSNIHDLVSKSFRFCPVHGPVNLDTPRQRREHAACTPTGPLTRSPAGPSARGPPRSRSL